MQVLALTQCRLIGNSSIGIFGAVNNRIAMIPRNVEKETVNLIYDTLKVPVVQTTIAGTILLGAMVACSPENLIVPHTTEQEEIQNILDIDPDIQIVQLPSKYTAMGNLVTCSRTVALVSPLLEQKAKEALEDQLSLEVLTATVAETVLIGSSVYNTDMGCIVHPLTTEEEESIIKNNLNEKIERTTVNRGVPYTHTGTLANKNGVVMGEDTTGPELMRVFEALAREE